MHLLRNLSIERRLTLTGMLACCAALALAGATFLAYDQVGFRRELAGGLSVGAPLAGLFTGIVLLAAALTSGLIVSRQIHARNAALQAAHDELGARVADRTRELELEVRERRRSEQALRETHQRFETVTRATSEVIWDRDLATEHVWRNENFQTVFGYQPDEVEPTSGAWRSRVHPDELPEVLQTLDRTLASGAQVWSSEYRFRRADGSYAAVLDRACVIRDEQGRPVRLIGAMQDITALKEAQQEVARERARFKFIFESVPVGISWFVPREESTHLVNPAHERITGVSAADSVRPGVFARVSHPDDYRRQQELTKPFVAGEIDHYTVEKRYLHPDGRTVWAQLTSRMFTDPATGRKQSVTTLVDITDLKRAHDEAERQQARFKFIFEAVPIGFTWMNVGDPASRVVNPAHASITGVSVDRCQELELYRAATHPDDRDRQRVLHDRLEAGEIEQYEIEKRYVHADGAIRWAVLTVRQYRDASRGEVQEISTLVDVTERKLSEMKLAEASGLLNAMLENTPDFIYFKDRASRFVRTSQALVRRFKLTAEDGLRGRTDFDFFSAEHAEPAFADEQEIIRTGAPIVGKLERETATDGTAGWALTTKMPWRDGSGEIIGTFGISKDITALKDAETRLAYERDQLRALFESSPDAIYFKDRESRFVRVSRSKVLRTLEHLPHLRSRMAVNGTAVAEEDLLNGLTDFDTYSGADAQRAFEDEQEIIRSGQPMVAKLEKQTFLDGSVRWSLTNKMPWRDRDGRVIGTFGTSKDITPLKEAEAKLEQMHRQLLEVSRQAGMAEVATGVLHNVGNVLNSVNVSATLVIDRVRESKAANLPKIGALLQEHASDLPDFLTRDDKGRRIPGYLVTLAGQVGEEQSAVIEELEQLRKNIEHIKDIVAMQQSYAKVSGVKETVAISELIDDALRMNAGALTRHGLELIRDYAPGLPVTVERHKVLQVLVNLIRNAKHACDDSGRTDKKLTLRVAHDAQRVRVSVIDNGVGIPAENLTRIFAHGFTTRKDGHGFGLHSGALVARELGGSLVAHSDGPGRGAAFTLELPFHPETTS